MKKLLQSGATQGDALFFRAVSTDLVPVAEACLQVKLWESTQRISLEALVRKRQVQMARVLIRHIREANFTRIFGSSPEEAFRAFGAEGQAFWLEVSQSPTALPRSTQLQKAAPAPTPIPLSSASPTPEPAPVLSAATISNADRDVFAYIQDRNRDIDQQWKVYYEKLREYNAALARRGDAKGEDSRPTS